MRITRRAQAQRWGHWTAFISTASRSLTLCGVLVTLAACATASSRSLTSTNLLASEDKSALIPQPNANTEASLFISPYSGDRRVYVYNAEFSQIGIIALPGKGSSVLSTDLRGNLYVAPQNSREVRIYRPPSYTQFTTIGPLPQSDLVFGIALDQVTGVLAVLECQCAYGSASEIYFYKAGQTSPCNVLSVPDIGTAAVFDREGTLYFQVFDTGPNGTLASVAGECKATTYTDLSFKSPIYPYGKLGISRDDDIIVQSFGSPDEKKDALSVWPLYTYAHPINGVFGDPIATTPLETYGGGPDGEEGFEALTSDGSHLLGSLVFGGGGGIHLFRYPQGGRSERVINVANGSVAVFPPIVPVPQTTTGFIVR
jgi:hypothetical protein